MTDKTVDYLAPISEEEKKAAIAALKEAQAAEDQYRLSAQHRATNEGLLVTAQMLRDERSHVIEAKRYYQGFHQRLTAFKANPTEEEAKSLLLLADKAVSTTRDNNLLPHGGGHQGEAARRSNADIQEAVAQAFPELVAPAPAASVAEPAPAVPKPPEITPAQRAFADAIEELTSPPKVLEQLQSYREQMSRPGHDAVSRARLMQQFTMYVETQAHFQRLQALQFFELFVRAMVQQRTTPSGSR